MGEETTTAGAASAPAHVIVMRVDTPLYTANVRSVHEALQHAVTETPGTRALVLDASRSARLSVTVMDELRQLGRELADLGVTAYVAALPPDALAMVRRTRWWPGLEREGRAAESVADAVAAAEAALPEVTGGGSPGSGDEPVRYTDGR
ncbi:MAG TPA: sodium-independent anion transporter [Jiangellaceae bacterium]